MRVTASQKRVLEVLSQVESADVVGLAKKAGIGADQTRRSIQELADRDFVDIERRITEDIRQGTRFATAAEKGLPERQIVSALERLGRQAPLEAIRTEAKLPDDEFSAGLGFAVNNNWITLSRSQRETMATPTGQATEPSAEELLIERLAGEDPVLRDELSEEERQSLESLLTRPGYVELRRTTVQIVALTGEGSRLSKRIEDLPELADVTLLTRQLIRTGEWRDVTFRPYDLGAPSLPLPVGRRHPLRELIDEIREIFVSLGFVETEGSLVELAFWTFDALFQPQDHPARDLQDTFYLYDPDRRQIREADLVERVRRTHDNGWTTGSSGWGGRWSLEEAERLVLRTHTTVVTGRRVYEGGEKPHKTFTIGKCYRNEKVTYKNTAEFYQVDGIIIDRKASLRHLMGTVQEFYRRLGAEKIRFWPSYFPYTEPSIQTSVYIERLNTWVELMGMGIFRPEVTLPLGVKWPVLAWGGGIERIAMIRYDIDDIRELYKNDLGMLRRRPERLS
ncbi:MAG: phenylalanine--tRNA ligase subunit alpha [Candidatus Geothermarchaeales archaeon]